MPTRRKSAGRTTQHRSPPIQGEPVRWETDLDAKLEEAAKREAAEREESAKREEERLERLAAELKQHVQETLKKYKQKDLEEEEKLSRQLEELNREMLERKERLLRPFRDRLQNMLDLRAVGFKPSQGLTKILEMTRRWGFALYAKTKKGKVVQAHIRQIEQNGVQVFDVYRAGKKSTTIYRRPIFPQLITAMDQKKAEEEFARREARRNANK